MTGAEERLVGETNIGACELACFQLGEPFLRELQALLPPLGRVDVRATRALLERPTGCLEVARDSALGRVVLCWQLRGDLRARGTAFVLLARFRRQQ